MDPLWAYSARTGASRLASCLLPAACCLVLAGCQNGRQLQTDLYHRELRQQEDQIYRLEDYVEEYQSIVCSQREEIADLRRQLASSRPEALSPPAPASRRLEPEQAGPTLATPADPRQEPSMIGDALDEEGDGDDPAAPGGFPGGEPEAPPFKPSPSASPTDDAGLEAAPPFKGTAIDLGGAARLATLEVERPDEPAALGDEALTASRPLDVPKMRGPASDLPPNPYPTAAPSPPPTTVEPAPEAVVDRGLVLSTSSGPDGTLVARLSGATDTLAAFRGTASLMLTDPRAEGKHKRIARWDYTAAEVSGLLASGAQALELLVQLPEATPTDRPLRLWVRLVDAKGARRLQAADVLLTGAPLRLAVAPQRLPEVEGPSRDFEPVPATSSAGWRPVREDRLVVPAGYDAAAE